MNVLQAIFLGAVQGITEFLPISSSGHLVIFQKIFDFSQAPVAFDTLIHFGTLIALLIFFRNYFKRIITDPRLLFLLFLGTIPIVIVGFLLREEIHAIFNSLFLVGISFLVTAAILFSTFFWEKKQKKGNSKNLRQITSKNSVIIGLFQALSILPGVSRSGSTIGAGLIQDIEKEDAFNFSFFLGIIAILGATIIQLPEISSFNSGELVNGILGFVCSVVVGFVSLKALKKVVIGGKFYYFGFYCLVLGIICLLVA